jgi:8-oxo-dGTP pyrophosphatase MutT (NUDIX family)
MTLAETLRKALDLGHRRATRLLEGDTFNALIDPNLTATPAAVLVAIVDRPEPGVILTVRTDTVRSHAGQVAFPGGRIDAQDDGPIAAALREAEEEIALPRALVEVIGISDRYRTITGYDVTPVIGVVPPDLDLVPQPAEVAAIFEVPLRHIFEPDHHKVQTMIWKGAERSYYEIDWAGQRIWGATAALIVNLSRRLELAL